MYDENKYILLEKDPKLQSLKWLIKSYNNAFQKLSCHLSLFTLAILLDNDVIKDRSF